MLQLWPRMLGIAGLPSFAPALSWAAAIEATSRLELVAVSPPLVCHGPGRPAPSLHAAAAAGRLRVQGPGDGGAHLEPAQLGRAGKPAGNQGYRPCLLSGCIKLQVAAWRKLGGPKHGAPLALRSAPGAAFADLWPRALPFPQGIYPISTTSEGSYRDPAIVDIINAHNRLALGF